MQLELDLSAEGDRQLAELPSFSFPPRQEYKGWQYWVEWHPKRFRKRHPMPYKLWLRNSYGRLYSYEYGSILLALKDAPMFIDSLKGSEWWAIQLNHVPSLIDMGYMKPVNIPLELKEKERVTATSEPQHQVSRGSRVQRLETATD